MLFFCIRSWYVQVSHQWFKKEPIKSSQNFTFAILPCIPWHIRLQWNVTRQCILPARGVIKLFLKLYTYLSDCHLTTFVIGYSSVCCTASPEFNVRRPSNFCHWRSDSLEFVSGRSPRPWSTGRPFTNFRMQLENCPFSVLASTVH